MFWLKALVIWLVIIVVESINGTLRTLLIAPRTGDLTARQIGLPIGAVLILLVSILFAHWLNAKTPLQCLAIGGLWAALTLGFELCIGAAQGFSPQRIAADYNPLAGGFMAFGLLFMALCPLIAARVRRTLRRDA